MTQVTDALQLPSEQRRAKLHELFAGENKPQQRLYLGRRIDRSAVLELKDTQGRDRIRMVVAADGTPSLQFLDEQGNVVREFPKEAR
jgi:hypothetical protein